MKTILFQIFFSVVGGFISDSSVTDLFAEKSASLQTLGFVSIAFAEMLRTEGIPYIFPALVGEAITRRLYAPFIITEPYPSSPTFPPRSELSSIIQTEQQPRSRLAEGG